MKIFFEETDTNSIVDKLKTAMGDRALSKIVNFEIKGNQLTVTLSKLGTSTLLFDKKEENGGLSFNLSKEKIALAHKALKGEVTEKIIKIVKKAGGTVA